MTNMVNVKYSNAATADCVPVPLNQDRPSIVAGKTKHLSELAIEIFEKKYCPPVRITI